MTDNNSWVITPKFKINETVYFRDRESVSKLTVKSIQPIIQSKNWESEELELTIRYYVKGYSNEPGKIVAEEYLFATADEAFK